MNPLFMGAVCLVNPVVDYFLIQVLHLGAAVTAQALSVVLPFWVMPKHLLFPIRREHLRCNPALTCQIVKLGSPIVLQNMCNEFSCLVIIGLVNMLGVVASSGVALRRNW